MKKTLTILVCLLLPAAFATQVNAQVSYEVRLTERLNGTFEVDVEIKRTSVDTFVLGTSTLGFDYNTAAIGTPTKVIANDGPWDQSFTPPFEGDYLDVALSTQPGFAGLIVEFLGGTPAPPFINNNGATVSDTEFMRIGTVQFTVINSSLSPSLAWAGVGTATQVVRLTNPGVEGGGQTNITSAGTCDADGNTGVGATDLINVRGAVGSASYDVNDVDMNGGVGATDLILTRENVGLASQVP